MSVPDLLLERQRLGEVTADEGEQLSRLAQADADVRARLAALDLDDGAWRASPEPQRLVDAVMARRAAPPPPPLLVRWAVPAGAAVLVAVAALAIVGGPAGETGPGLVAGDGDRIKGLGASLAIYRWTGTGSELLADGAHARQGDVVRIGYRVASGGYGVILSVDGRGHVTIHWPDAEGRAAALDTGGQVLLDRAFELDDAPEVERFHFIAGPDPFAIAPVVEAVRAAGAAAVVPGLDPALDHTTVELRKDARP